MACVRLRCVCTQTFFILWALVWAGPTAAEPLKLDSLKPAKSQGPVGQIPEVTDAVARFRARDYQGALDRLKQAAQEHKELPPAQVFMAQLFINDNQPARAQKALEDAVIEAPDDPEAYWLMGQIGLQAGRHYEANLLFEKADALLKKFQGDPKRKERLQAATLSRLAQIAMIRQDWKEAKKRLDALVALVPDNGAAKQSLARTLFGQDQVDKALATLQEAAKLDSNLLTPEAIVAGWYQQAGKRNQAYQFMKKALEKQPRDVRTRLAAVHWAFETGQLKQAANQADSALRLAPNSLEAKLLRGSIAYFQRDFPQAEKWLEVAHLQSPSHFSASNNLALVLAEQNDETKRQRALEYARMNATLYNKQTETFSTLGWVLYKLGRLDDAERALREAAKGPMSADTAYYIARVSADRGRRDEAIRLLQRAVQTSRPFAQRKEAEALLEELTQGATR